MDGALDPADLYDGLKFMESHEYAKAIVSLQEIERQKGARFETYELQGHCYFEMKSWRSAIRSFSSAMSYLESPRPNLHHFRGLAHLYLGEFEDSLNDLFLALRYTPVETLSEEADLLSTIFFACVLAGDERAQSTFAMGYSRCPVRMMEKIQELFDVFFVTLDVPVEEKLELQKHITELLNSAKEDQQLFEERSRLRGDKLKGLLGDLKRLRISKSGEETKNN